MDEAALPTEDALALVTRLAQAKVEAGRRAVTGRRIAPVLGADTVVEIDGEILGKPRDRADAEATLAKLSGRCHRVFSGVALWKRGVVRVRVSQSEVCFRSLDARERRLYCERDEALDKAGAYAIQGLGATFVETPLRQPFRRNGPAAAGDGGPAAGGGHRRAGATFDLSKPVH